MKIEEFDKGCYASGVKNWAAGRERVLVSAVCKGVGIGRGRANSPDFPLKVIKRGGRKVVLVEDIVANAPLEWLVALAKLSPLPPDAYELKLEKIRAFFPQFLDDKLTMSDIAREIGLTRERVRQIILSEFGETARSEVRVSAREKRQQEEKDELARQQEVIRKESDLRRYGALSEDLLAKFGPKWDATYDEFLQTRRNALMKPGIVWNATFLDWLDTWKSSKPKPGIGRLCFSRKDRNIPYEAGNLRIIHMSELIKEVRLSEKSSRPMAGVRFAHA